jgi:hypothetical protein
MYTNTSMYIYDNNQLKSNMYYYVNFTIVMISLETLTILSIL